MKVVQSYPVEIAMRTLGEEDRRRILAWFEHLANWENDQYVRDHSQKLPSTDDVYVLTTSSEGWRIFFRLEDEQIEILDIASKATILSFANSESDE